MTNSLTNVVFLGENNTVKLGDFGLSKLLGNATAMTKTYVGTPYYMSPEICGSEAYGWHSDIWALGCIMYELCTNTPPFDAKSHPELAEKIRRGVYEPLPSTRYSRELRTLIQSCLQVNPAKRPTTRVIINEPLIRIMRKQRENLAYQSKLQEKEAYMKQRVAEAESLIAKTNKEMEKFKLQLRNELKAEIDASLRREWEVKARLEIDRLVQLEQTRLQKIFDVEFEKRTKAEVTRQVEIIKQSMVAEQAGGAHTPVSDQSSIMSFALESPFKQRLAAPSDKKPAKTPLSRAKTQVPHIASPMDVTMADPSPMCASLSLSPRRAAAMAGLQANSTNNVFTNDDARSRWEPQMSNIEDSDEDDEFPEPSSPTRQPRGLSAVGSDPFQIPPVRRPGFRRQATLPSNNLGAQNAVFGSNATNARVPVNRSASSPSPTRRPQRLLVRAITTAGNINSGAVTSGTTGRTLVELNQAQTNAASQALVKPSVINDVSVWDPEKHEMPSPFVIRTKGRLTQ
jgi:NIMA (never in mitosis gene a)-related kinase 2